MQNVILNKSHFCKKLQFLTSLPNFDQNLQKKIIFQDFFVIRSIPEGKKFSREENVANFANFGQIRENKLLF